MNGINSRLGAYICARESNVRQLGLIDGWLLTFLVWGDGIAELAMYIFQNDPEPITESEYKKLKKGKREPRPDWGLRYEVMPDAEAATVARRRADRAHIRDTIKRAPLDASLPFKPAREGDGRSMDDVWQALVERMNRGTILCWLDLRAIESVLEDAAAEFDGEDVAIPVVRMLVDWIRVELLELHEKLITMYGQECELPEPSPEHVGAMKSIAHWPGEDTPVNITLSLVEDEVRRAMRSDDERDSEP
ncbi:MAG: hypothetical protein ABI559_10720 [Chloroflexota bacterium]